MNMKRLFGYADEYIKQSNWKDFALLKFCLCSMGIMLGLATPKQTRKIIGFAAMGIFIVTYIQLMLKFLGIVSKDKTK